MPIFIDPSTGKMSETKLTGYVPFQGGSIEDYKRTAGDISLPKINNNPASTNPSPAIIPPIITSDQAKSELFDTEKYLKTISDESKAITQANKDMLAAETSGIENSYAKAAQEAEKQYAEMGKTSDVVAFRLGQKGTQYDIGRKQEELNAKNKYFSALNAEKNQKISELNAAYRKEDMQRGRELRQEINNIVKEQRDYLQRERQNQISESLALLQEGRAATEFNNKQIETAIPALYNALTGTEEENAQVMADFASQYGVNPNTVIGKIIAYENEKKKEDLLNTQNNIEILSKIKGGGKITLPGFGEVEVVGTSEKPPETMKASGKIYSFVDGMWKDTGIKDGPDEVSIVADMISKYGDAGIKLTDTLEQAGAKLKNSRIYQDQVRRPVGSGGGGGDGDTSIKLTPEQKELQNKINAELVKLAKGGDWGESWNFIKNLYPDIPNENLDEALRKDQFFPKEESNDDDNKKWYEFWK